jgi:hypothetical protein
VGGGGFGGGDIDIYTLKKDFIVITNY